MPSMVCAAAGFEPDEVTVVISSPSKMTSWFWRTPFTASMVVTFVIAVPVACGWHAATSDTSSSKDIRSAVFIVMCFPTLVPGTDLFDYSVNGKWGQSTLTSAHYVLPDIDPPGFPRKMTPTEEHSATA